MTPLKHVRENKVYTIRDCALSDITCDDNGVNNKINKVKHDYYVVIDEDGVQAVKWVHKSKDGYYRYSKTVSVLKMIVIRTISAHNEYVHTHTFV